MDHACCHQPMALLGRLNPIFMSLRLYCGYFAEIWCDWTLFIWSMKCWIVMVSDVQFNNSILKWQRPITVRYSMRFLSRPLSNAARRQLKAGEITSAVSKCLLHFVWRDSVIDFSDSHLRERISVCRSVQSVPETLWERMGKKDFRILLSYCINFSCGISITYFHLN